MLRANAYDDNDNHDDEDSDDDLDSLRYEASSGSILWSVRLSQMAVWESSFFSRV